MKTNEAYFSDLFEQITDSAKWSAEKFVVFNHEAGTGKSRTTHEIIGEMTKIHEYRVLYVQRFARDNELENTVDAINMHAGRKVAESFTGEDTKKVMVKEIIEQRQVICITHQMYIQICKGEHKYLIKDRDILIIDEYLDLLEKLTISSCDIGLLWAECNKRGVSFIGEWAQLLRDIKDEGCMSNQIMRFIDFKDEIYQMYVTKIKSAIEKLNDEHSKLFKGILTKSIQLLKNGGYLFENAFHTIDGTRDFVLLKNNIILDANGEFEYRYKLSQKFDIRPKEKMFEYSKDFLFHYEINTTKNALKKDKAFLQEALKKVELIGRKGVLYVTEMENTKTLEKEIINMYSAYGNSIEDIEKKLQCKIKIDYFGNIIGVNYYREYDTVVLLKTPNYDYLTYASTLHYYSNLENKPMSSVEVFKNDVVESIRKSSVAGELYQAIKRINRDNSKEANIYLFSAYMDAVDLVVEQLPNIKYIRIDFSKREYNSTKRKDSSKLEKAKSLLLDAKEKGLGKMKKDELREQLEIKDKSGLSSILRKLYKENFFEQHGIDCDRKGQTIWFKDDVKQSNIYKSA
ncbi:hypothetical protein [Paenibacillus sp. FSL L8-0709]|uniref:hypothetical protein n=1 Tax=Paenibacillus sp. FSL L8-0709 TaxID=2975312 RepID=UPI0030F8E9D6